MSVMGISANKISERLGVVPSTVTRIQKREDIQKLIEEQNKRYLESLPSAVDNMNFLVNGFLDETKKDEPDKSMIEYGFKASTKVLESAGITTSPNPSVFIQNIFNQQNLITPMANALLDKYLEGLPVEISNEGISMENIKNIEGNVEKSIDNIEYQEVISEGAV